MTTFKPIASKLKEVLTPETWCQKEFATDSNGNAVKFNHPSACKFCIIGALERVTNKPFGNVPAIYISHMRYAIYQISESFKSLAEYNDTATDFKQIQILLNKYEQIETTEYERLMLNQLQS